jgi:hypothetical protein
MDKLLHYTDYTKMHSWKDHSGYRFITNGTPQQAAQWRDAARATGVHVLIETNPRDFDGSSTRDLGHTHELYALEDDLSVFWRRVEVQGE